MPQPTHTMNWDGDRKDRIMQEELNKQLLDAAKSGDLETVKNCLYYGADIEAQDNDGCTSLICASAKVVSKLHDSLLIMGPT